MSSPRTRLIAAALAIPALTVLLITTSAAAAQADPSNPGAAYAGVGADTTEDVVESLSTVLGTFESWNATRPGSNPVVRFDTITPKGVPAYAMDRPNGDGDGLAALRISAGLYVPATDPPAVVTYATVHPVVAGAVDFARTSRPPRDAGDTSLTWIPFGTDGADYAVVNGGVLDQVFPAGLTSAQLQAIYTCRLTSFTLDGTVYTLQPYVPRRDSGTRWAFENALGFTDSAVNTTCVRDNVFPTRSVSGLFADPTLVDVFVGNASRLCAQPDTINIYGFRTNADCGSVSLRGKY